MTEIPPITDPMGKYWDQPPVSDILVDDTHALMTFLTWKRLAEYSSTLPTGTYTGKMWKAFRTGGNWFLCWYGAIEGKDILIHTRAILLV